MNLKNRLRKLEQEIEPGAGGEHFCQCFDKNIQANINQAYGEPYIAADILPEDTLMPKVCTRCGKPVEEQTRQLYNHIEEIYSEGAQL